jgi:hypothetical protein
VFLKDQSDKTSVRFEAVGPEISRHFYRRSMYDRRLFDEVHEGNEGRCEMPLSVAGGSQGRKARLPRLRVSAKRGNLELVNLKSNGF